MPQSLLSLFAATTTRGYSPWLIHDDHGHWAVCADGISTIHPGPDAPFLFEGQISPSLWHSTPEAAIQAWLDSLSGDTQ